MDFTTGTDYLQLDNCNVTYQKYPENYIQIYMAILYEVGIFYIVQCGYKDVKRETRKKPSVDTLA